nr:DUF3516 domain-containing protein [Kribbella antibiotica]
MLARTEPRQALSTTPAYPSTPAHSSRPAHPPRRIRPGLRIHSADGCAGTHHRQNVRLLAKAGDDPKKQRRVQRKKPPEGFVTWGEAVNRTGLRPPTTATRRSRTSPGRALTGRGTGYSGMPQAESRQHEGLHVVPLSLPGAIDLRVVNHLAATTCSCSCRPDLRRGDRIQLNRCQHSPLQPPARRSLHPRVPTTVCIQRDKDHADRRPPLRAQALVPFGA